MNRLKNLLEKREEYSKKPCSRKDKTYNNYLEYHRYGELILEEVERLYEEGELDDLFDSQQNLNFLEKEEETKFFNACKR